MLFRYTATGADPREWEFRPLKLPSAEAEAIERLTDWEYPEFGRKFMAGSIKAHHALLYVFLKRTIPTIKWGDVQFTADEIEIEYDRTEKQAMIDGLVEKQLAEGLSPEEEMMLGMMKADLEETAPHEEVEVPKAPPQPKRPLKAVATGTDSNSQT